MNENLIEELKEATKSIHESLDKLPFFSALMKGNLPIESYINYLHAMAGICSNFEKELNNTNNPQIQKVWDDNMQKLPLLLADLESLNSLEYGVIPSAIDSMLDAIKHFRISTAENSINLLGVLYVLEGSTLGGAILKKLVQKLYNLKDDKGVLFLDQYKNDKRKNWEEFKLKINNLNLDEKERGTILQTAVIFFQKIETIVKHLYPITKIVPFYNATTLNPEAGQYNIPDDKLEIQAAIRAGISTWEEYPYYAWRYGLRGKQFTRSDSAWIVTLCDLDEKHIFEQIDWLGRLLSTRGMPQILLANHLVNLVNELDLVHPEKKVNYHKLLAASNNLKKARDSILKQENQEELIMEFEKNVGEEWSHRLKNMGIIILSAVADEKLGIANALINVQEWATNKDRFPEIWIDSIQKLIKSTKELINSN